jgi:hypothetical protein
MSMERKAFDRELYRANDNKARQATKRYFERKGYTVYDHPDQYAQDLVVEDEGATFCVECEVKNVWSGERFPYQSVQLPERKSKFFNTATMFFIWNKELTHAMTFWSQDVQQLEPVEVPNKYVQKGEYFYQIPMDMVEKVEAA